MTDQQIYICDFSKRLVKQDGATLKSFPFVTRLRIMLERLVSARILKKIKISRPFLRVKQFGGKRGKV